MGGDLDARPVPWVFLHGFFGKNQGLVITVLSLETAGAHHAAPGRFPRNDVRAVEKQVGGVEITEGEGDFRQVSQPIGSGFGIAIFERSERTHEFPSHERAASINQISGAIESNHGVVWRLQVGKANQRVRERDPPMLRARRAARCAPQPIAIGAVDRPVRSFVGLDHQAGFVERCARVVAPRGATAMPLWELHKVKLD